MLLDGVIDRLKELYPDLQIVLWIKDERGKLFVDDHPIVRYFNIDLLEKQLKAGGEEAIRDMVKYFAEYIEVRYLRKKGQFTKAKGHPPYNLTEAQVKYAIANTKSNSHAARFLNICLTTYKKYADMYGLYEGHTNKEGKGISKRLIYPRTPLSEIFENKHPNYHLASLKYRMIHEKILPEECEICGENKPRLEDGEKPILLDFKDGNEKNMAKENLRFICYNCAFRERGRVHIRFAKRQRKQMMDELKEPLAKPEGDASDSLFDEFNKK
jgi:hypothetical protein